MAFSHGSSRPLLVSTFVLACAGSGSDTEGSSSSSSTTTPNPTVTEGSTPDCEMFTYDLHVTALSAAEAVEFVSVAGLNSHAALALAADGRLFRADDAGVFHALAMPADPALRRVEMADADTWMAIGAGGLAHRSSDGGDSWSPVDVGTEAALRDVVFFNFADPPSNQQTLHGVIVGDGVVLRSDDAGATWSSVALAPELAGSLRAVDGSDRLVAVGDAGLVIHSFDGGVTWAQVDSGTEADLLKVAFVYDDAAIVAATGEVLDRSGDAFGPNTPAVPAVDVGRVDDVLAVLHSDGTISGWPESEMVAEPVLVGAGARVLSRGNASGALAVGDAGLAAFVMRTINEPCELPDEF
ncbi:YCF48-related protein [Nannocystis sp. SCPEA4]|uniref:WD40/YVTN/BNR-like repeat-containing protein n=1 Tax=Nannocystis sp. SCPEA4 TaxID=2996787 RepID=UPI002271F850|nr:YCF48-related protein [Nannocystis sp. SCPEA4]MCY1053596.1 YCF48-related protein [Nannocystis sp. SCPEA4]